MFSEDDTDSMRSGVEAAIVPSVVDQGGFDAFGWRDSKDGGDYPSGHAGEEVTDWSKGASFGVFERVFNGIEGHEPDAIFGNRTLTGNLISIYCLPLRQMASMDAMAETIGEVPAQTRLRTTISVEHPLYKARYPSSRNTLPTTTNGFFGVGTPFSCRSWTLVFANSKGY